MNLFTISDIESLSGIKAHTLRIWEQRYHLLQPKRYQSNHRYYDNEDLRQILQIAQLNRNGYKISRIARMNADEIKTLALDKGVADSAHNHYIEQLIQASLELDEERFNRVYQSIVPLMSFDKLVLHIFYPLLERIGVYWMAEKTRPVQEHFASHLIVKKIITAINAAEPVTAGNVTLLFNPFGEHHEIPILFIQYLLKKNGNRTRYFGANISTDVLKDYIQYSPVYQLHLHVITNFSNLSMDGLAQQMIDLFPQQQIIISGPLTKEITVTHERLAVLRSLNELTDHCQQRF
jgi:MerR family transcriptional regulator, light-induced transcriptional regulator